jgi:hypothetical protein
MANGERLVRETDVLRTIARDRSSSSPDTIRIGEIGSKRSRRRSGLCRGGANGQETGQLNQMKSEARRIPPPKVTPEKRRCLSASPSGLDAKAARIYRISGSNSS